MGVDVLLKLNGQSDLLFFNYQVRQHDRKHFTCLVRTRSPSPCRVISFGVLFCIVSEPSSEVLQYPLQDTLVCIAYADLQKVTRVNPILPIGLFEDVNAAFTVKEPGEVSYHFVGCAVGMHVECDSISLERTRERLPTSFTPLAKREKSADTRTPPHMFTVREVHSCCQ